MARAQVDPLNPSEADCRVRPEDLEELPKIHALLKALNDPMANIGRLVGDVRVLSARCVRRARLKSMKREVPSKLRRRIARDDLPGNAVPPR